MRYSLRTLMVICILATLFAMFWLADFEWKRNIWRGKGQSIEERNSSIERELP